MKKYLLLIMMMLVTFAPAALADGKKGPGGKSHAEMRREMEDFKMKFLAQEMELSEDLQTKFFDIYRKKSEGMAACFKEKRKAEKRFKAIATPSETDYAELQKVQESVKEKEKRILATYNAECKQILSSKQLYQLDQAEEKFRNKMLELKAKKHKKKN